MQIPLQITFHGIDRSEAMEERIRAKVSKLEQYFDNITSLRVAIERVHNNAAHKSEVYRVGLNLVAPGTELVVKRDSEAQEDAYSTLRNAFQTLERQVKDHFDRLRAEKRSQPPQPEQ